MPEISEVKAYSLELPLKDPFETAKGRKTSSPAVIVELHLSNGLCGLGSATPVKYVTGEDIDSVLAAIEMCAPDLKGSDPSAYLPLFEIVAEVLPVDYSARAALEIAILDAFCKLYHLPMCYFFGGMMGQVETDLTISIQEPETARESAKEAAARGFTCLKVKVGGDDMEEDLARIVAVNEGAPECDIRIDANQGFTPTTAAGFLSKVQAAGVKVDMFEQPVDRDDLDGLRYVTQHTHVPVFADESAVTPADALKLIKLDAVDGINVKLMKCGIAGAMEIIAMCKAARKELMLGSMIESGIGLSTAVHLACGTGAFARLDLDSHLLLAEPGGPFAGGYRPDGPLLIADCDISGHGSASTAPG